MINKIVLFLTAAVCLIIPFSVHASLSSDLSGMILLDVERNGEAWYVFPGNLKRYYLGRPQDAFRVMRELGLGIAEKDFQRLAQAGVPLAGDLALARRLSGKIVIQSEKNGEAWYIYPKDLKKYYLGRPEDAFRVMRELGLGVARKNLALIHKPGAAENIDSFSAYEHKKITARGYDFTVDMITIDMSDPDLRIISQSADKKDCDSTCSAFPLAAYVLENGAFAGINGTYFESYNRAKINYYFFPVYNSKEKIFINEDQLKYWTTGPIFVWDENNRFYYFKDSREFSGVRQFEEKYGVKIQAAIGNKPRLIENGQNLLIEWDIDTKQRDAKLARNAIGVKGDKLYLVIAQSATVPDLAEIMKVIGVDYALNLDGGYSSALWYGDEYMVGPGRNIPNAIVFAKKKNE